MRRRNRRFARWHAANRGANSTYVRATTDTLSTTSWPVCAALTDSYGRQVFLFSEEPGVNGTDERGGVFHGAEIRFVFFAQDELVGWDEKALSLDMVSGIMPNV